MCRARVIAARLLNATSPQAKSFEEVGNRTKATSHVPHMLAAVIADKQVLSPTAAYLAFSADVPPKGIFVL